MSWGAKISAALLAVIVALVVGYGFGQRAGADRVEARWNAERQAAAEQRVKDEQASRAEEKRRAEGAQRILVEVAQGKAAAVDRAARAERAVVGLRNEIARLNAPAAQAGGNAESAGHVDEASVARELLGACAQEYRELAAQADELRDQVTGLQGWVGLDRQGD